MRTNVRFKPRINTIRLPGRDYAQAGAYFVTTATHRRQVLFGHIENKRMVLNEFGRCVDAAWLSLPKRFHHVDLDVHVIMPDHIHGIITLTSTIDPSTPALLSTSVGAGSPRPTLTPVGISANIQNAAKKNLPVVGHPEPNADPHAESLGQIIAYFKYTATRAINTIRDQCGVRIFERGYYERIVRDDSEWNRVSLYIRQNPEKWDAHV
jgi:REP element-mobilizing transposase RayT